MSNRVKRGQFWQTREQAEQASSEQANANEFDEDARKNYVYQLILSGARSVDQLSDNDLSLFETYFDEPVDDIKRRLKILIGRKSLRGLTSEDLEAVNMVNLDRRESEQAKDVVVDSVDYELVKGAKYCLDQIIKKVLERNRETDAELLRTYSDINDDIDLFNETFSTLVSEYYDNQDRAGLSISAKLIEDFNDKFKTFIENKKSDVDDTLASELKTLFKNIVEIIKIGKNNLIQLIKNSAKKRMIFYRYILNQTR